MKKLFYLVGILYFAITMLVNNQIDILFIYTAALSLVMLFLSSQILHFSNKQFTGFIIFWLAFMALQIIVFPYENMSLYNLFIIFSSSFVGAASWVLIIKNWDKKTFIITSIIIAIIYLWNIVFIFGISGNIAYIVTSLEILPIAFLIISYLRKFSKKDFILSIIFMVAYSGFMSLYFNVNNFDIYIYFAFILIVVQIKNKKILNYNF